MAKAKPEGTLDITTQKAIKELASVARKWFKIGLHVGVPYDKLQEFKGEEYPLAAVLDFCLKGNVAEALSWESLVEALKSEDIGETALADKIYDKFCKEKEGTEEDVTPVCKEKEGTEEDVTPDKKKQAATPPKWPAIKPQKVSPNKPKQQEASPSPSSHKWQVTPQAKKVSPSKGQEEKSQETIIQKDSAASSPYAGCYVFINHSNLWKAGKRIQAKKLHDTNIDDRYRIDLGKFLSMLAKGRSIFQAYLYGSRPPPNDSVWKAAREKNYTVKTYERSGSGKEKELNAAMACKITECKFQLDRRENVTFIIVTGDRDLKTAIDGVLESEIPVELWSWQEGMSRELRQLANTNDLFKAQSLDSVEEEFSYTSCIRYHPRRSVDPTHAIVYKDIPASEDKKDNTIVYGLADYLHNLMRLFYIIPIKSRTPEKQDLIVEFPKTKPEVILKKLKRGPKFPYEPCSWPEYARSIKGMNLPAHAFETFEIDDSDAVLAEGLNLEDDEEQTEHNDDWGSVLYRNPELIERMRRRREIRCKNGDHCAQASECPSIHTDYEKKMFDRHRKLNFKFLKTRLCEKIDIHTTDDKKKWCTFAHNEKDSWCLRCKMYGHLTENCKFK